MIAAHGCHAMTVTTALTAQNTLGVVDIHHTPPDFVRKLIDVCISDIGVDVVKTGIFHSLCIFARIHSKKIIPWNLSDVAKECLPLQILSKLLRDLFVNIT